MRNKLNELDVDFIGDGKPLTKEEETKISEFIRNWKEKQDKINKKSKTIRKKQETV